MTRETAFSNSNSIKACGYFRLSREDGDKSESDSIKNQRLLVRDFASRKGIVLLEEYVDDGFTGTNFNRPSFIQLWNDIREGRINCVIVKDLSRLGRNYIEMGRYLTQWFPQFGVRVIAINDNYDSIDNRNVSNQIVVPFKNLINDAYCRDMSIKVRSQLDMKRKKGKFIGSFAAFGYEKDEINHNKLVIDETAGKVVELIFNMKLDGYSTLRIVEKLTELGIPTPLEYKRLCGRNFNSGFRSKLDSKWSATTVNRILRNEIYTGTMVQGKHRKVNYKVKKCIDVSKQDWIRVENTHEAIVPRNVFEAVQKLMEKDTRVSPKEGSIYVLSGMVKCGGCGQNLVRRMTSRAGKKYYYYYCTTYKNKKGCSSHNISEKCLYDTVFCSIQSTLSFLAKSVDLISSMENRPLDNMGLELLNRQMEGQVKEINRYNDLKVKLYMDMTDGVISKEEFKDINATFTARLDRLNASLRDNERKKEKKLSLNVNDIPWIHEFLEFRNVTKLDRRVAVSLIESIVVYGKDRIEVNFHHMEELNEILSIADEVLEVGA